MEGMQCETPRSVETVTVIKVVAARGAGTNESVLRLVTQYWDFDGVLLCEDDPAPSIEIRRE